MVVWWGATVEIQSAFHRLFRESQISNKELAHAQKQIEVLRRSWIEVLASEQLRGLAERLPETYGLRALDAFQLAAALIWCKEKPRNRFFVCFDEALAATADRAGFAAFPATSER